MRKRLAKKIVKNIKRYSPGKVRKALHKLCRPIKRIEWRTEVRFIVSKTYMKALNS